VVRAGMNSVGTDCLKLRVPRVHRIYHSETAQQETKPSYLLKIYIRFALWVFFLHRVIRIEASILCNRSKDLFKLHPVILGRIQSSFVILVHILAKAVICLDSSRGFQLESADKNRYKAGIMKALNKKMQYNSKNKVKHQGKEYVRAHATPSDEGHAIRNPRRFV
jgi:hypothetical protein